MYKVFFNDSFLILANKALQFDASIHSFHLQSFNQIEKWLLEAEMTTSPIHLICICENPTEILLQLQKSMKFIEAAGGLVKNKKGKYLFIFRRGKWDLPKGKMEKAETPEQSAIREVLEETGLKNIFITHSITNTYHIYRAKGRLILKKTYWFAMKNQGLDKLIPQCEEDIEIAKWMKESEIPALMDNIFGSVVDVVKAAGL